MKAIYKNILLVLGIILLLAVGGTLLFVGPLSHTFFGKQVVAVRQSLDFSSAAPTSNPIITEEKMDVFFKYSEKLLGLGMSAVGFIAAVKTITKKKRTYVKKEEPAVQLRSQK